MQSHLEEGVLPAARPSAARSGTPPIRPGLTLALVCAAKFVVILDLAIVNVALPSIQSELHASSSSLQWVVIAYGLTLGGGLLLGGRIADLFGRRNTLAAGLLVFAMASLAAGLAGSLGLLVGARAVQGIGGALAVPAALSILTETFPEGTARNKALGVFGAVAAGAGTIGVVAGGALTSSVGWEWIFLINVPVGLAFAALVLGLIPASARTAGRSLDVAGAVTVTTGLMALVYGINQSAEHGWTSTTVVVPLVAGAALLATFAAIESRARFALMPLSIFRHRTLTAALGVSLLLWGSQLAVIFQGTLYMQQALGYSAIATGVAWLAATCSGFATAGGVAPRVIGAIGPARSLVIGQVVMAVGLLRLVTVSVEDGYWSHLFPAYLAMGIGTGLSMVALQVAAFSGIDDSISGLAGGLIETSAEVGGAIGIAVVATLAIARTDDVLGTGADPTTALTEGYQQASLVSALLSVAAAIAAAVFLRRAERPTTEQPVEPGGDQRVRELVTAD
jgi:EmrB/QacA subfamily drug resistance transporter